MRIGAVTGSLVLHSTLIAAAFTLPAVPTKRAQDPVSVDLYAKPRPEETPAQKEAPPKEAPPKLAMREPQKDRLHEPTEALTPAPLHPPTESAAEPPKAAPPSGAPPGKVDLTLHALPGGSDDAARVPDGPGTFGGTLGTGGKKPWKMRGDAGNPLTGKLADVPEDRFPLTAVDGGEFVYKGKAFHARIGRDGRVSFDDKSIRDFKGLSGGFDITDMLMRAKGNDPYRAEKQAFMELTEPMRKKMALAELKERQVRSLDRIPTHLDDIWRDPRRPAAERRKLLYESWLDAASSERDAGDAAQQACGIIELYVRRYLPEDSESAFTVEELERYNRGQRHKFDPYH